MTVGWTGDDGRDEVGVDDGEGEEGDDGELSDIDRPTSIPQFSARPSVSIILTYLLSEPRRAESKSMWTWCYLGRRSCTMTVCHWIRMFGRLQGLLKLVWR